MKNRVLMVLMTLLVCCFVQPTAKAMDQPAKISGKTVYDTMANGDFKAITLNPKSKYEFTLSWEDDGPAISINGTRVENVDVTYDEESISLIGKIGDDKTLMSAEIFVANDELVFRASDLQGHGGVQYTISRTGAISRASCTCSGSNVGVTVTTACTNAGCDNVDTCRSNGGGAVLASCKWLAASGTGDARIRPVRDQIEVISLRDVFSDQ